MAPKYPSLHTGEVDGILFHFFNFCEHPVPSGATGYPTLYMNLAINLRDGVTVILYSVRLVNGQFINPYYTVSRGETKTMSYLSPAIAQAVAEAWRGGPVSLTQKWFLRTNSEAWQRLCFDPDKIQALAKKPYLVLNPGHSRSPKKAMAI